MTRDHPGRLDRSAPPDRRPDRRPRRPQGPRALLGGVYAFTAYLLWGFLPLYFLALAPTGPWELVAWRILLSLGFCAILLTVMRGWRRLGRIMRQPRLLALTALAGALIYVNWQVYIVAALTGHVIETSLGYFINPIVTVLLGVLVLRERLRVTQWAALGAGGARGGGHRRGLRRFPLGRADPRLLVRPLRPREEAARPLGRRRERTDARVDVAACRWRPCCSSSWRAPPGSRSAANGAGHAVLLGLAGVVTATPLLLFAAGSRRVPLTVMGMLQFVAPILQFIIGVWLLGEPMSRRALDRLRLVWVALVILTVDSLVPPAVARGVSDVAALT